MNIRVSRGRAGTSAGSGTSERGRGHPRVGSEKRKKQRRKRAARQRRIVWPHREEDTGKGYEDLEAREDKGRQDADLKDQELETSKEPEKEQESGAAEHFST